ncbi:tetratricopeptide repeat protein [Vulgatibacter incomptus]|nr:hypothetical protein [Vulgatibacter incomptus]
MEVELVARAVLARKWKKVQEESKASDPYLNTLVEVYDARLLAEYGVAYLSKPGWFVSPEWLADLDLERFGSWAATNLAGHEPQTHAYLHRNYESPFGPPPGAWIPEQEAATDETCRKSAEEFFEGVSRWKSESAELPAPVVAARSQKEFATLLERLSKNPAVRARGLIWAHPSVATLHFRAGFCAVSLGEYERALEPLQTAIELSPFTSHYYGELAQALIHLERKPEALKRLAEGIEISDDPCELAYLLRTRGFIQVENGELALARVSYRQSLELAPGNANALRELALIEDMLSRSGLPSNTSDVAPLPLPRLPVGLNKCH